jgi:trehalose-6-phosphate synthase
MALTMAPEERREKAERLRLSVEREDIDAWLRWQLEALTELELW